LSSLTEIVRNDTADQPISNIRTLSYAHTACHSEGWRFSARGISLGFFSVTATPQRDSSARKARLRNDKADAVLQRPKRKRRPDFVGTPPVGAESNQNSKRAPNCIWRAPYSEPEVVVALANVEEGTRQPFAWLVHTFGLNTLPGLKYVYAVMFA